MVWLALVVFTDPDVCHQYVVENRLMEQMDWQCVLIEDDTPATKAPEYSLRPVARPTTK